MTWPVCNFSEQYVAVKQRAKDVNALAMWNEWMTQTTIEKVLCPETLELYLNGPTSFPHLNATLETENLW